MRPAYFAPSIRCKIFSASRLKVVNEVIETALHLQNRTQPLVVCGKLERSDENAGVNDMDAKLDWEKDLADCIGIVLHSRLMTLRALLRGSTIIVVDPTEKGNASELEASTQKSSPNSPQQSPLQAANHRA